MQRCGVVLSLVLLFAVSQVLSAQQTSELESGLKPFGSFQGSDIDLVSLSSGNLVLRIPLISYPQRGGLLRVNYILQFNAKSWYPKFTNNNQGGFWTWTSSPKGAPDGVFLTLDQPIKRLASEFRIGQDPDTIIITRYYAITPDGASHEFEPTKEAPVQGDPPLEYESINGTGIKYFFEWVSNGGVIVDRDGVRHTLQAGVEGPSITNVVKMEDPNGNSVTINSSLAVTDTLGRVIGTQTTASTSSCPSGTTLAKNVAFPGFQGGSADMIFCFTAMTFNSNFGQSSPGDGTTTGNRLIAVLLPNQTKWQFAYTVSGDLASITLPTGGTISYTWQVRGTGFQVSRWVQSRTVNDGTGNRTWDYAWGGTPSDVTVTHVVKDPADASGTRNEHGHTFKKIGNSYYETRTQDYAGSMAGGVVLKTVNTAYDGGDNPDTSGGGLNVVPRKITTIWPTGKVSEVQRDYDSGVFSQRVNANITYGNVIEERVFDYGQNTPGVVDLNPPTLGALLVKTKRTYRALEANGTTYKDNNLVDLISQLDTCGPTDSCDGAPANSTAQTRYGYDEGTVTAFPSTLSTLNTSPPGPRGNRTSAARWSSKRTPAGFVTTTSTYFNTGMVKSVQDPQTHTTNFDYSPTFWGGYLTQSTNALNQTTSSDYDFSTGLPKSTTDPNGVITKFVSYDTALRLTQKKLAVGTPNEAQIDYFYTDTIPAKVKVTVPVAGTTSVVTEAEVDGLGRSRVTRLLSDPQGTVSTRVQYDNLGRKLQVWNASRCDLDVSPTACTVSGTVENTFGVTIYEYDALGRTTKVVPPDGTTTTNNVSTNFTNYPTVVVTDQQGKQRRSTADALGRIVQVDEPGTAVQP